MTLDLTPSDDLRQIRDAAQSMLDQHYPVARLRDGDGVDPMAPLAEFGAFVLALPEDAGGAGFSLVEEAALHVDLGRHLLSPTALATAVAMRMTHDASAEVCAGAGPLLIAPGDATHALIRDDGLALVALAGTAPRPEPGLGHGRPVARLDTPPAPLARATPQVALLHDLLCAAQLLGVATGARDLAVAYARTREQFGRPIGSFQAIKHHCANMTIAAEMLSAQLDMAAIALRDGRDDAAFQVAALARLAPRIALDNARTGIQIHGGIGFSAEADAQLYLKQAHVLRQLLIAPDLLAEPAPMAPTRKAPA